MDVEAVAVPAISAAGGGLTVGWIAKLMIQNWLKRHDDMASEVRSMVVQLTRVEEQVKNLQRSEQATREQDRLLAVVSTRLEELKEDLNGVGRKVRTMEAQ